MQIGRSGGNRVGGDPRGVVGRRLFLGQGHKVFALVNRLARNRGNLWNRTTCRAGDQPNHINGFLGRREGQNILKWITGTTEVHGLGWAEQFALSVEREGQR